MKLIVIEIKELRNIDGFSRFYWNGLIENSDPAIAEVSQVGFKVTRDEAIRNAQHVATILNMRCEIPNDPCV